MAYFLFWGLALSLFFELSLKARYHLFKLRKTFYLVPLISRYGTLSSLAFPRIISLVLLEFANILLSCVHFISSSVISFMIEGVPFLRISVTVTSSINLWRSCRSSRR